ncbi:MAG: hypothetical protein IPJ65_40550 [Archangiaceae bacterium]|nr:hypothetical protein [Archangiaceae bacterium]
MTIDVFSARRGADGVWVLLGESAEDLVSVASLSGLEAVDTEVQRPDGSRQRVKVFRDRPDAGWVRVADLEV